MSYIEVTILVLCFNSGRTVIETLNSCKEQTYKDIHLVISDDSSSDSTYETVKRWSEKYSDRFLSCTVLRTRKNLGVSRHMNSCMAYIPTEWFKGLAADDILLPDAIEKYVKYVQSHKCHGMVYAKHVSFKDTDNGKIYFTDYEELLYQKKFNDLTVKEQLKSIAMREVLCSPTCFSNKNDIIKAGGYDLRIKNIEDWPIKIRLIQNGYKMNRIDEFTVLYRVGDSVSRSNDIFFKPDFLMLERKVKKLYCYPLLKNSFLYKWNELMTELRYGTIIKICRNRRTETAHVLNILLGILNTHKVKKAVINTIFKKRGERMVKQVLSTYKINEIGDK